MASELVVTGEGKLDITSFEGKVVGGVLEWAADAGVSHRAVIVGQATDAAREEAGVLGDVQVLALTDRVWSAGEAFSRAAVLVEEAAVEAGRRALGHSRNRRRVETAAGRLATAVERSAGGDLRKLSGELVAVVPAVARAP